MDGLKSLVVGLVAGLILCTPLAGQQAPNCAHVLFCLFNQEAAASDPAGIHNYSKDLIGLIVPLEVGNAEIKSVTDRLARAEQMARTGSGKLVAEADVVQAFNELMAKIGAPQSVRTDDASMRRFREHTVSIKAFPELLSADRNGSNCNPGEAVFLFFLLMSDNGVLYEKNLDTAQELLQPYDQQSWGAGGGVGRIAGGPEAQKLLSSYVSHHNRKETAKLFNDLAGILGF